MNLTDFNMRMQGLSQRLKLRVYDSLYKESETVLNALKERSPIDSGLFASNWFIGRSSRGASTGSYASVSINNNTIYGIFLDEGAKPGGVPWYWPNAFHPPGSGSTSRSGKLILKGTRVYAGGKSPTGHVAPHGISNEVLLYNNKRQRLMANAIGDAVVRAI